MTRRSVLEIESQLFRPGSHYLLASFARPKTVRERELRDVAEWFGLDEARVAARLRPASLMSATEAWLELISWCGERFVSEMEQLELKALIGAMENLAARADALAAGATRDERKVQNVTLEDLWDEVSQTLQRSLEQTRGGSRGLDIAAVRGRRWSSVRGRLARELGRLQGPESRLLPREPREPGLFDARHYQTILDTLTAAGSGGLAVISAPVGSGKGELALSYAHHERNRYDQVLWLRATDIYHLEQDFLSIARHISRSAGGREELRRKAFQILETSNRWIMVFQDVADPAILLPYLPWNPRGHKLCTCKTSDEDAWASYFSIIVPGADPRVEDGAQPALLEPLEPDEAQAYLQRVVPDGDNGDLLELGRRICASRFATALAGSWLSYTGAPVWVYLERWDELDDFDVGLRAARLLLRELSEGTRWRSSVDEETDRLEEGVVEVLKRLEPYDSNSFPQGILDDPEFATLTPRWSDKRVDLLERLGLADNGRLPRTTYLQVSSVVFDAVRAEHGRNDELSVAVSSRTVLSLMQRMGAAEDPLEHTGLLNHAAAFARREAPEDLADLAYRPRRPLIAVELYARAALGHLKVGRMRPANAHIRSIQKVFRIYEGDLRATLGSDDELWAPVDCPEHIFEPDYGFKTPIARMAQLIEDMRRAGHANAAARLFGHLDGLLDDEPNRRTDRAQLLFEGGLALHDDGDFDGAWGAVERARQLWEGVDARWHAAALSYQAVLELDRGDIAKAGEIAEEARKQRAQSVKAAETKLERLDQASPRYDAALREREVALEELARSLVLLGRIADHEGRIKDAKTLLGEGIDLWRAIGARSGSALEPGLQITEMIGRSHRALMLAVLGDHKHAEPETRRVLQEAKALYPTGEHRNKAMVMSNVAQVLRSGAQWAEARELHTEALEAAEYVWSPDHRITTEIRRACATTLLDAGRTETAFAQLIRVLRAAQGTSSRERLARARAWTVLGRLLLQHALTFGANEAPRPTQLDLARGVYDQALRLFTTALKLPPQFPEVAACLLGLAEINIHQGRSVAVDQAREALRLLESNFSATVLVPVLAKARYLRAQVVFPNVPLDSADCYGQVDGLKNFAQSPAGRALAPAAHLEIALAAIAIDRHKLVAAGTPSHSAGLDMYESARACIDSAMSTVRDRLPGEPHLLLARGYAELADIAENFAGGRQRARSERERDRSRPPFNFEYQHQSAVDRLLHADETAA